jgi:hypothetical protein
MISLCRFDRLGEGGATRTLSGDLIPLLILSTNERFVVHAFPSAAVSLPEADDVHLVVRLSI